MAVARNLSDRETRINEDTLRTIFEKMLASNRITDAQLKAERRTKQLTQQILAYADAHRITLNNLVQKPGQRLTEEEDLMQILADVIKTGTIDGARLDAWKNSLTQAIPGQGNHIYLAQQRGMAHDLITQGQVPAKKWGTDLDAVQCLGADLTPANKITAGINILQPISLTELDKSGKPAALTELLAEAVAAAPANQTVSLRILANCGNNHWRLVKGQIENNMLTEITLWDSMSGKPDQLMQSLPFENMSRAVDALKANLKSPQITKRAICAGIQKNTHSCMDYALQEAYRGKASNEISQATNATALRVAVVRQIARNSQNEALRSIAGSINEEDIGGQRAASSKSASSSSQTKQDATPKVAKHLESFFEYINWGKDEAAKAGKSQDSKRAELELGLRKQAQIEFDQIFAEKLDEYYKKGNDNAEELARNEAIEEYSNRRAKP